MRITLRTHGNPTEVLNRPGDTLIADLIPNLDGKTVTVTRNGELITDVSGDFELQDGDTVMTVANKRLG